MATTGARDLYQVLGVSSACGPDELRRAYRALALECHPDRNQGSPDAEERFKELAEAFRTLSDPRRRAHYDRYGYKGVGWNGTRPDSVSDLTSAIEVFVQQFQTFVQEELGLGDGERAIAWRSQPQLKVTVSLDEVVTGACKELPLPCSRCGGTGSEPFAGNGRSVCAVCVGTGTDPSGQRLRVDLPPGVESGDLLPVRLARDGRGTSAANGVFAMVEVEAHPRFARAGADLVLELPFPSVPPAGGKWEIPTPTGTARISLPSHARPGGALRLAGLRLPPRAAAAPGDLIVKLATNGSRPESAEAEGRSRRRALALAVGRRAHGWAESALVWADAALAGAKGRIETLLDRFLEAERRLPQKPLLLYLEQLQAAAQSSRDRQLDRLAELQSKLTAAAEKLEGIQPPLPARSREGAAIAAEDARVAQDGLLAIVVMLFVSTVLGVLNVFALENVVSRLALEREAFALPALLRLQVFLPFILTGGAFASGMLLQALGTEELPDGLRGPWNTGGASHPALAKLGPFLLAVVVVTLEGLLFASLGELVDVPALLGLTEDSVAARIASHALLVTGVGIPLCLTTLGSGFWHNFRKAFELDVNGRVDGSLRKHLRRLRSLPADVEKLHAQVKELGAAVAGLSGQLPPAPPETEAEKSVAQAAAEASDPGSAARFRSREAILGGMAVGAVAFALLGVLFLILYANATAGLAQVGWLRGRPGAGLAPLALALSFPVLGYLVKDALFGSSTAAVASSLPHQSARAVVAGVAGAGVLAGTVLLAWLTVRVGGADVVGAQVAWVSLAAAAAALLAFNLDGWTLAAAKASYVSLLGGGWLAVSLARALLVVTEALLGVLPRLLQHERSSWDAVPEQVQP